MDDRANTSPTPTPASASAAACDAARNKTIDTGVAENSNSNSVKLIIKSSNQQYDDINIDSDLCWTVQRLKKQLSLVYPGKPDISDQKLIYSGKLLDDKQKLSEVIRSYKDVYQQHHIFHLVCANKNIMKPLPKMMPPEKNPTTQHSADNAATNNSTSELRQRHAHQQQAQQQGQRVQQPPNPVPALNPWLQYIEEYNVVMRPNQISPHVANPGAIGQGPCNPMTFHQQALTYNAWMQQVYAHYMQEMMQQSAASSANAAQTPVLPHAFWNPFMSHVPMLPTLHTQAPNTNNAPDVGVEGNDAAMVAPINEPAEPQPAAAPAEERNFPNIQEDPEQHDWLDSFFSFTRLAIFVTVLYFNSSPMRCLLVILIASLIYLYHIGVLRRRRERNNNNINRNNNAADEAGFAPVQPHAAVQQIQRMMDVVEREDDNQQEAVVGGVEDAGDGAAAAGTATVPSTTNAAGGENTAAAVAAEAVVIEPPNANNSVISAVRTFVITFFTSLLPEAPL